MRHRDELEEIVRGTSWLMSAFRSARALNLPDWWIVSGALYGVVWNHLSARPSRTGIKDVDLFYFDPDISWKAEDAVIRRGAALFDRDPPVEIRNQARVHVWFEEHFGIPCDPLADCADGIRHFASRSHSVGMRLLENDDFALCAPYGLESVFAMRVEPNPLRDNKATHETKGRRHEQIWPELEIVPWPTAG